MTECPAAYDAGKAELISLLSDDSALGIAGRNDDLAIVWARGLRNVLGDRAEILGFNLEDNPTAHISDLAGGHDFVIVDGRYLADAWLVRQDRSQADKAVFDLHDSLDARKVDRLYGDRELWESSDTAFKPEPVLDRSPRQSLY